MENCVSRNKQRAVNLTAQVARTVSSIRPVLVLVCLFLILQTDASTPGTIKWFRSRRYGTLMPPLYSPPLYSPPPGYKAGATDTLHTSPLMHRRSTGASRPGACAREPARLCKCGRGGAVRALYRSPVARVTEQELAMSSIVQPCRAGVRLVYVVWRCRCVRSEAATTSALIA